MVRADSKEKDLSSVLSQSSGVREGKKPTRRHRGTEGQAFPCTLAGARAQRLPQAEGGHREGQEVCSPSAKSRGAVGTQAAMPARDLGPKIGTRDTGAKRAVC